MKNKELKIVGLFDLHIPYNINLKNVFRFIKDFNPDIIVLGGDVHDFTPASHWIANQSLLLDGKSILKCYKEMHDILLNPLREVMSDSCEIKYLEGNHEDWLRQSININRNGQGYWEIKNNIDFKKYNITFYPQNIPYRVNENLCYIHGAWTNEYHAKKTVQAFHTSVFYSHVHDVQSYIQVSPVDVSKFYKGQSCGCLCSLNPSYARNRPNKWVNGFHFCYVNNKYFHDVQVNIVKGKFYANGKYYN